MNASSDAPDPNLVVPESLKRSGFPFQTAIADVVARTRGWRVGAQETPWQDEFGKTHFLDIVAASETGAVLTIEVKKTEKEMYVFLLPEPARNDIQHVRLVYLRELTRA